MDQLIVEDPPRIGPYRLIARLGAGGMGLVYLGRSEGGRTVAVKVVQAEYAGNPEFRRRFAREVAAARRVGGSWTAAVLDADPEAAVPWVATQYIPGPDLHTVVAKDFGPLPEYSVRTLANRLALALRAVHEAGLIHRDLKPSNVLVTVDGPRVIDFGIARAMDSLAGDSLLTHTGMLIGSAGFMSPEQVRGLELTPASDVFCLGAVLVYAATGRLLFGAGSTGLNAHLFRVAEEEADLTGVPESLAELVGACLHKDPARRPTPAQVAERTAAEQAGEWLPGTVLAQLGRHAAQLLDFAPAAREEPAPERADPRVPAPRPHPLPPAYAPTAGAAAEGFGPPPGPATGASATAPEDAAPAVPEPARPPAAPAPRPRRALAVVCLLQLMLALVATVSALAAPAVQSDLGADHETLNLLLSIYWVAFGALLPLGGHFADLVGRKRVLIIGLAGFGAASVFAALAPAPGLLIAARALQGAFAALLAPATLSLLVTGHTDPRKRGTAFGIYVALTSGGPALGLLLAGPLVQYLDWRACLFALVPFVVVGLFLVAVLPGEPAHPGARSDPAGALLGSGGLALVLYGLFGVGQSAAFTPLDTLLLAAGSLLTGTYLWRLSRGAGRASARYGITVRHRAGAALALLLAGAATLILSSYLSYYLANGIGYAPDQAGLMLLPMVAAMLVGATQVSARLAHRAAPGVPAAAGLVLVAVGLFLLIRTGGDYSYAAGVLPATLLTGLGTGTALGPLLATATTGAALRGAGVLSAAAVAAQQVGETLATLPLVQSGYPHVLWWAFGAVLLAAVAAALMITAGPARGNSVGAPVQAR
ncbi:MDR family MFS transporter [Streptomyces sp. NPDC051546]|uniref:MDR family MFS transporter n=1 Tax=Streptomyces sp. NPDC051546 TaxID=3365655 RepID=UPI0037A3FA52